jgi:4-amino-4-deoxy-L-arabinose transferase-like glycosyltransferase
VRRYWPYFLVAAACALPRAAALAHERGAVLASYVEKSDVLAKVYLHSGTFGYVPGEPSASTQPLYAWFLIAVYWIAGRHWWSLGTAQIAVAVGTALLVYEIGRRFISRRAGLFASIVATLSPYLVWHDIHANREILDQLVGAAMFLLALLAGSRRSLLLAGALGVVSGVAVLSNSRLLLLPLALAAYLLWRQPTAPKMIALLVPALAAVALVPWVVRNKVEVGCFSITTDARALWKANNLNTYRALADGGWIDDVPEPPNPPLTPTQARDIYLSTGRKVDVHECAQESRYTHLVLSFWEHHPGAKAKLMVQATQMLWTPSVTADSGGPSSAGAFHAAKHILEPAYVIPLYVLALIGLFFVSAPFRVLALIFVGYETLAAWVFAGTTRYRVPWDFVLALLAAAAVERLWRPLRRSPSQ